MIPNPFSIGQKAVCIDPDYTTFQRTPRLARIAREEFGVYVWPQHLSAYTIRSLSYRNDRCFLLFEEVFNPDVEIESFFGELGFLSSSFRPLVERKTDISCLEALLIPSRKKVSA